MATIAISAAMMVTVIAHLRSGGNLANHLTVRRCLRFGLDT
jgi:hypothetical protein